MELYDALFTLIFNILSIYADIRALKLFLHQKETNKLLNIALYGAVWLINWFVTFFLQNPDLITLSLFISLFIITNILYEGTMLKKIVVITVAIGLGISSENLVWFLLSSGLLPIHGETVEIICSALLTLMFLLFIERCFSPDKNAYLSKVSYWIILILSISSIVLADILIDSGGEDNQKIMLGLSIICLMNIGIYYLYEKISEAYQEKLKNMAMAQRVDMYLNQFGIIRESQQNISGLRHDMKNHFLLLHSYISKNKYEEALRYIENLDAIIDNHKIFSKTGNLEIDSILNYILNKIDNLGCKINIDVEVPTQEFMSVFDLNVILGNLLDNAFEALQKTKDKILTARLTFDRGILYIHIHNTFDEKLRSKNGKYLSSKEQTGVHGIGLDNVRTVVKKYSGLMNISTKANWFMVDIVLYINGVQK